MLEVKTVTVTGFQQNCRIAICTEKKEAVIVDPGGDAPQILKALEKSGATLAGVWLTHSHLDHCGGVAEILRKYPVELWAHPGEKFFRQRVTEICAMYGMPSEGMENCPEPQHLISGGETLSVGNLSFAVLFTPGHSPGHVCFHHSESRTLLAGDTLFAGSIGRTDLPGGNGRQLLDSIESAILSLPDDTKVLPGHGPDTTVGVEREGNPFLQG